MSVLFLVAGILLLGMVFGFWILNERRHIRVQLYQALILYGEWFGDPPVCLVCFGPKETGHRARCQLKKAIGEYGNECQCPKCSSSLPHGSARLCDKCDYHGCIAHQLPDTQKQISMLKKIHKRFRSYRGKHERY